KRDDDWPGTPDGPQGDGQDPPEKWSDQPKGPGATGAPSIAVGNYEVLGARTSFVQASMLLHHAELDYLNRRYSGLPDVLNYLEAITSGLPGSALPAYGETGAPTAHPMSFGDAAQAWKALRGRVLAYIGQLNAGLDFFGNPPNYVSLVAREVYRAAIDPLI